MVLGKCFRLFKELKTHIEAKLNCLQDGGILAKPKTFVEAEFLEGLVAAQNSENQAIWLDFRRGDIEENAGQYFSDYSAHSDGNLRLETGDCLMMKIDNETQTNLGWHRSICSEKAFYICEQSNFI